MRACRGTDAEEEELDGGGSDKDRHALLIPMGSVRRQASGNERVACVRYSPDGTLLAVQGGNKTLEVFRCGVWRDRHGCHCHGALRRKRADEVLRARSLCNWLGLPACIIKPYL